MIQIASDVNSLVKCLGDLLESPVVPACVEDAAAAI